nr:MAG TPA: hypothetical protein [Caudoviricetes sp.]
MAKNSKMFFAILHIIYLRGQVALVKVTVNFF